MEKQTIITTFLNASHITDEKVKKDDAENRVNYYKFFSEESLLPFTRENNARESMSDINIKELESILLQNVIEVFMVRMHQLIRGKITTVDNQELFLKYKELTDKKGIDVSEVKKVMFSKQEFIEQMVNELELIDKLEDKTYISKMSKKISELVDQYPDKYQNYFKISYFLLCELREEKY